MINPIGRKVKDKITGFTGIVTGHVEYISGCNQCLVVPPVKKDGSLIDAQWFDDQRIQLIGVDDPITLENILTPGADKAAPIR